MASGISLEVYLSNIDVFRVASKLHFGTIFGNGVEPYIVAPILDLIGCNYRYIIQECVDSV